MQGIKAIRAAASVRPSLAAQALSASLQPIQEEERGDHAVQLPTPWETPQPKGWQLEPILSDTLFSATDVNIDFNDTGASRSQTDHSGNPQFTIVDCAGVFDMVAIFCVCSGAATTEEQLFRAGLFPATFKQIETLLTFSVLEDFLTDNLECKTTAQQYYSKLQSMTSKMFPNNVPVRCISNPIHTYDGYI